MNFTAWKALPCSLDVAKYFSCQGHIHYFQTNQGVTHTSSLSANGYEFAALTKHELGAQTRSKACYTPPRQRSRAGIVTTKTTEGTNATGIMRIPAAFVRETLEISSLRGTTSACRNGSGDAACAAPWPRSDGSARA